SVWAWRPGRARRLAHRVDHLLTLLPFEPPYFTVHGLACTYVGHPVLEAGPAAPHRPRLAGRSPVLCLLPGRRRHELPRLAPIFRETLFLLRRSHPGLETVLPTVEPVADLVRDGVAAWPHPPAIVEGEAARNAAFATSDLAVC